MESELAVDRSRDAGGSRTRLDRRRPLFAAVPQAAAWPSGSSVAIGFRGEARDLRVARSSQASILKSQAFFKCPRQESNLVYDLRKVACTALSRSCEPALSEKSKRRRNIFALDASYISADTFELSANLFRASRV